MNRDPEERIKIELRREGGTKKASVIQEVYRKKLLAARMLDKKSSDCILLLLSLYLSQ